MTGRKVLLAPLLAALAAAPALAQAPSAAPVAPVAAPAIVVVEAKGGTIRDRVIASGLVQPVEQVDVQPQVDGLAIERLEADVGDRVEAGQVLVTLSTDALELERSQLLASRAKTEATLAQVEAQIAEARANAEEARQVAERAKRLSGNGAISEAQVLQADAAAAAAAARLAAAEQGVKVAAAELKVADAQLSDVDLKLRRTEVKAPVAGIVSARNARIGAIASGAGDPLFMLIRDGRVELRADVAEADVGRVRAGQAAAVSAVGMARPIEARVRLVEPVINATTRLGLVRIDLGDAAAVRPGMYADADVTVAEDRGVLVPISAVAEEDGKASVLLVEGDRVKRAVVALGARDGGMVAVLSGLAEGTRVVAKAGAFVRDGDRINPILAGDPLGLQAQR